MQDLMLLKIAMEMEVKDLPFQLLILETQGLKLEELEEEVLPLITQVMDKIVDKEVLFKDLLLLILVWMVLLVLHKDSVLMMEIDSFQAQHLLKVTMQTFLT